MTHAQHVKHIALLAALVLTFIMCVSGVRQAHAISINDVRFGQYPDKVRMVLDISNVSQFRVFMLFEPYRMVIDLPNATWNAGTIDKAHNALISDVRQGTLVKGISRIVFDLKEPALITSAFILPQNGDKPNRLVIDYKKTDADTFMAHKSKVYGALKVEMHEEITQEDPAPDFSVKQIISSLTGVPIPPPNSQRPKRKSTPQVKYKKPMIIIDPGHGGTDPGALGPGKIYEKNLVLALAIELKKQLIQSGKYNVKMTRERDVFIRLHDRVKFARKHKGDLFISIHADSIHKSHVSGSSIYTLSKKASDAQTAKLAEKENQADLMGNVDFKVEDEQVAFILGDFLMNDTMNQSKFFANNVVKELKGHGVKTLKTPHRYAGFAVLKAPDIPSILIEAGFVSNHREAKLLNQHSHRRKIAKAIRSGIDSYFDYVHKNEQN